MTKHRYIVLHIY